MATGKLGLNLAFGCITLALALTAATALYKKTSRPAVKTNAMTASSGTQLPENHPEINLSKQISAFQEMIARDPKNPEYQTQIANLYYDAGQYETAADHYKRSLSLRPGDPNVETDLAVCFHYTGQDDKALEALNNVLTYSPGFSQALFNKGIILINTNKDLKEGIRVWEELLRVDPGFAQKAELQKMINKVKETIR